MFPGRVFLTSFVLLSCAFPGETAQRNEQGPGASPPGFQSRLHPQRSGQLLFPSAPLAEPVSFPIKTGATPWGALPGPVEVPMEECVWGKCGKCTVPSVLGQDYPYLSTGDNLWVRRGHSSTHWPFQRVQLTSQPRKPTSRYSPGGMKACVHKRTSVRTFTADLVVTAPNWKQPESPSTGEQGRIKIVLCVQDRAWRNS